MMDEGKNIHDLAKQLWGINRSITGEGVRQTLSIISEHLPDLKTYSVKSGTRGHKVRYFTGRITRHRRSH